MKDNIKPEEFYRKLKSQLAEFVEWPSIYLYKFIIPSSLKKIAEIQEIFDGTNPEISTKDSSGGKYTSISIYVKMDSPEAVIAKYKEVGEKIEGVISL